MKEDMKDLFRQNYLKYASYVILDRAIPNVVDGLKPVQRRILWTLYQMDDGKLHKVANAAGQTMALHPHGDAPIVEAIVNLANKNYLLDTQGNFGNPLTGDPAAAARYIETRLSALARETLFNPDLMTFLPSYDGRTKEPVLLPTKIPLLLMLGSEGIAVGMATKILPHNFQELLKAEIAILEGRSFKILPDFPSGGIMDPSEYNRGKGKVKLRAKIKIIDDKTLIISEICYGTTTESLIRSIDEAAKKGKIKIDSIQDYTAEKIEIEIKLPRGQYADQVIDALYAFTECEVALNTQMISIRDYLPWEANVDEILKLHVELLQFYLKKELEIERERLLEKIFEKSLEQIFIENRLYKKIEEISTLEQIHTTLESSLKPYHKLLLRIPTEEDRNRLLQIPIRRISRFDLEKNQKEISALLKNVAEAEKNLKNIKQFTIRYIQKLLDTYGPLFSRKTKIQGIEELDKRALSVSSVRVSYDPSSGYLGTKVAGSHSLECTNLDKLLILYQNGTYQALNIPQKQYVHTKDASVVWVGVADKKTILNVIYQDQKTRFPYAKRFIVKQFILDKEYRFLELGTKLEFITSEPNAKLQLKLKPKVRKAVSIDFKFDEMPIKGVGAKGVRIANKELQKVKVQ